VIYFLLIDGGFFEGRLRHALAGSWRVRSFSPCRDLCRELLPRVKAFHERYHVGENESLLERAAGNLPFGSDVWYALAGELLLYAAEEVPEFQTCPDTLSLLVAPEQRPLIEQTHRGSRPLTFGAAVYRPEHCGRNDAADVRRLSRFLASLDPTAWTADRLGGDEPQEELAFARDCFAALADTFRRADEAGQVVVHELL